MKAMLLPTCLFHTSRNVYPVLGRDHKHLLRQLLKLAVKIIVQGSPHHGGCPLSSYVQYLECLGQHHPPALVYELYTPGYKDCLQRPLQTSPEDFPTPPRRSTIDDDRESRGVTRSRSEISLICLTTIIRD